jgi:hypothetical protein
MANSDGRCLDSSPYWDWERETGAGGAVDLFRVRLHDVDPGTQRSRFSEPPLSRSSTSPPDCVQGRERLASLPRLFGRGRCRACEAEGENEPIGDPGTPRVASKGEEGLLSSLGSLDGGGAELARRRGENEPSSDLGTPRTAYQSSPIRYPHNRSCLGRQEPIC